LITFSATSANTSAALGESLVKMRLMTFLKPAHTSPKKLTSSAKTLPPDFLGQALQFRVAMSQPIGSFSKSDLDLQKALIIEEFMEFTEAYERMMRIRDLETREHALKELADLSYVIWQFAACAGWQLDEALDRVHRSNISKLVDGKPVKDANGKVTKGPNYVKPYLQDLV
jgi:NTP pyrophosphatase (non-canonical NTP hydrolase)